MTELETFNVLAHEVQMQHLVLRYVLEGVGTDEIAALLRVSLGDYLKGASPSLSKEQTAALTTRMQELLHSADRHQ